MNDLYRARLHTILRDPENPRELRFSAYRALVTLAGGFEWQKACQRIENLAGHPLSYGEAYGAGFRYAA